MHKHLMHERQMLQLWLTAVLMQGDAETSLCAEFEIY